MLSKLLYRLYAISRFRRPIRKILCRVEDGEMYSKTLRKVFKDYHAIDIGMYSYGGCFRPENINRGTSIGRYSCFAADVKAFNRNHPLRSKSLHPFFYNEALGIVGRNLIAWTHLEIGNDVWVGQGTIILPSCNEIGTGAVIGAGSIVTKDVPPYAVVVGNPAKIIKYRFRQKTIRDILDTKWWERDIDEIKANRDLFESLLPRFELIKLSRISTM